ncbi:AraC family transcriptional regulator [Breoghania sp. L-A4]|uniref:AraC family transcriptional regulator n=1 Tax=Breoghania sp. L-A4 TaxID=2304600 RepID=UPI000E35D7BE|nr:AraC family transcriptional regulator [Breoghania sp. L-A4]AXS41313.1 AraC family transcriptional regulator [Breoghania sp. L-A4]
MTITQFQALEATPLASTERALFWREPRYGALECLSATFRTHAYAPHTHETYVVGVIEAGCEAFTIGGEARAARPGDVCFVNPGVLHDGAPLDDGYAYRMTYPSVEFIRAIAEDMLGCAVSGTPRFISPVIRDPALAARFARAHRRLEAGAASLEDDEAMQRFFASALARYADLTPPPASARVHPAIERARDYMDAHLADNLELTTLAGIAGLSRHHFLRVFAKAYGQAPHAWLLDRRVHAARRLLGAGLPPPEVAVACGFCDQSHLNRAFKRRIGVTPGAFRAG